MGSDPLNWFSLNWTLTGYHQIRLRDLEMDTTEAGHQLTALLQKGRGPSSWEVDIANPKSDIEGIDV